MLWLWIFWISVVLATVFLVAIPFQSKKETVVECLVLAMFLLTISYFSAPHTFGYGKVTSQVEEFSIRLKEGVTYHLIHSERQDDSYVLLMNELDTYETLAIRGNTIPPEIFTLVNGKIVAIQPK